MKKVAVRIVRRANRREMLRLYKEAGWWKPAYSDDAAYFTAMVRGSFCFVGAFINSRMIGMGRCISDGVSDAYIHDVTVLTRFRGKGIGGRIITKLVEHLRAHGIEWIGLISEPEAQQLYKELGFKPFRSFTPMVWVGDE
ncbi:MAG: GNAT family N-acetyltransferase [Candidatus Aureabacteria bacterium]|nr:GNAT family N-acetyltransferase [Candidatus Auribacterota bacterium]